MPSSRSIGETNLINKTFRHAFPLNIFKLYWPNIVHSGTTFSSTQLIQKIMNNGFFFCSVNKCFMLYQIDEIDSIKTVRNSLWEQIKVLVLSRHDSIHGGRCVCVCGCSIIFIKMTNRLRFDSKTVFFFFFLSCSPVELRTKVARKDSNLIKINIDEMRGCEWNECVASARFPLSVSWSSVGYA